MKTVSFKVAKAIKNVGYPQGNTDKCYLTADHNQFYKEGQIVYNEEGEWTVLTKNLADIPTYMEVWLWLWREKNIKLSLEPNDDLAECYNSKDFGHLISKICNEPEEAIIAAIEYLVDNNLIE